MGGGTLHREHLGGTWKMEGERLHLCEVWFNFRDDEDEEQEEDDDDDDEAVGGDAAVGACGGKKPNHFIKAHAATVIFSQEKMRKEFRHEKALWPGRHDWEAVGFHMLFHWVLLLLMGLPWFHMRRGSMHFDSKVHSKEPTQKCRTDSLVGLEGFLMFFP